MPHGTFRSWVLFLLWDPMGLIGPFIWAWVWMYLLWPRELTGYFIWVGVFHWTQSLYSLLDGWPESPKGLPVSCRGCRYMERHWIFYEWWGQIQVLVLMWQVLCQLSTSQVSALSRILATILLRHITMYFDFFFILVRKHRVNLKAFLSSLHFVSFKINQYLTSW